MKANIGLNSFKDCDDLHSFEFMHIKEKEKKEAEHVAKTKKGDTQWTEAQKKKLMERDFFMDNPHLLEFAKANALMDN